MNTHAEPDESLLPKVHGRFRLQWEQAQQSWVLLYPEGMVKLNQSAGEIMKRCDGASSVRQIIADLEHTFEVEDLGGDVREFLQIATRQHWLEWL